MSNKKLFAPFLMLLAGAVVSIVMFLSDYDMTQRLTILLLSMLFFYCVGLFIQKKMVKFLDEIQKKEETQNILNGVNFARKVIDTGGCDVLVLDEILGLIDLEIITVEDIIHLIELRDDYTRLVLTGQNLPEELVEYMDVISKIELEKDITVN